jgi:ankyrin repeat protein
LEYAAKFGNLDVVRVLIQGFGADVNQVSTECVGIPPVCFPAAEGHVHLVRYMVRELAADVDQARSDGVTPLYIAAEKGARG